MFLFDFISDRDSYNFKDDNDFRQFLESNVIKEKFTKVLGYYEKND